MADTTTTLTSVSDTRSPESRLRDHMERVEHARGGRFAVVLNLSQLRSQNRQPHHIRIASRSFDSLLNAADVQIYILTSGDLVLMCKDIRVDDVDYAINKVRTLFQSDPLARTGKGNTRDEFTTWYDFEIEFEDFKEFVADLSSGPAGLAQISEDASAGQGAGAGIAGQSLDAFSLAKIDDSLNRTRIGDMIREQAAVIIGADGTEQILFYENFVSVGQIQQRFAPGFNLGSNIWLFNHLTETIDRRLLRTIEQDDFGVLPHKISLNLNISTVMGKDFQRFEDEVSENTEKVIIELQQMDVFSDIPQFRKARNYLKDRGYGVLIDGLSQHTLQLFNPGDLEADFYKVAWGIEYSETESIEDHAELAELVDGVGKDRFILARTDSEEAIRWALTLGVRRFQGFFIDTLVNRQIEKEGRLPGDHRAAPQVQ